MFHVLTRTCLWYEMSRCSCVWITIMAFFVCARGRSTKCVIIISINIFYVINYHTLILQPPTPSLPFEVETVPLCTSHFVCDCGVVVVAIFLPPAVFADVCWREVIPARVAVRIAFRMAALAPLSVRQVIIVGIPLSCAFLSVAAFLLFDWLMCPLCCHNSLKHGCYLAHVVTDCCRWCDDRWYLCTVCMVDGIF